MEKLPPGKPGAQPIAGQFEGGILGWVLNLIGGAVGEAITNVTNFFNDLFDGLDGRVGTHDTELAGLQDKTQKLEGVIGYGHAYSTASISLSLGSVRYGMTNTIGPTVGVTWPNGAVYLGSKGLWIADAQVTLDVYAVGAQEVELGIKVFAPNGSLHAQRYSRFNTGETITLAVHMPFTVPSAGYYVELWVNAAIGRGIFGGSAWNGLSVNKISMETS